MKIIKYVILMKKVNQFNILFEFLHHLKEPSYKVMKFPILIKIVHSRRFYNDPSSVFALKKNI